MKGSSWPSKVGVGAGSEAKHPIHKNTSSQIRVVFYGMGVILRSTSRSEQHSFSRQQGDALEGQEGVLITNWHHETFM